MQSLSVAPVPPTKPSAKNKLSQSKNKPIGVDLNGLQYFGSPNILTSDQVPNFLNYFW